jgi:hypothetical protein
MPGQSRQSSSSGAIYSLSKAIEGARTPLYRTAAPLSVLLPSAQTRSPFNLCTRSGGASHSVPRSSDYLVAPQGRAGQEKRVSEPYEIAREASRPGGLRHADPADRTPQPSTSPIVAAPDVSRDLAIACGLQLRDERRLLIVRPPLHWFRLARFPGLCTVRDTSH